jgi:MFS family permease
MPSLGDAFDEATDEWERRRLYFGTALLFVGAVVAAPGLASVLAGAFSAAGVAEATAVTLGIAIAALAVPFAGAALLRWVPSSPQFRTAGAAGVVLSTVAVAAFVALGPADLGSVPLAVVATYVVGALLALWSPILAAGMAAGDRGSSRPSTAFVRERRSVRPGQVPADGGEEDQELAFLLDNDDK